MTLAEYITANLRMPFVWGSHDCVLFAANWIKHSTGIDHLADAPKWTSAIGAARIVKRLGGLEKLIDDRFDRIHPNLACDGDIALHEGCVCLFSGSRIAAPGQDGLLFFNRTKAECAWRVA
jgi:hypothetical protein